MGNCAKKCSLVMFFTSLFLIIAALIVLLTWGSIYPRIVKHNLIITNTSTNFDMWKETPIPMYLEVHMFNWTNSEAVIKSKWKTKPILEECGPYIFSEHHIRVNLQWNSSGTITYQQKRIWHFLPELSHGSLNDTIININPIVAVIGHKVKRLPPAVRWLVNVALRGLEGGLVTTQTVDALIFQGYNDTILKIARQLNIPGFNVPFDKFGWFYSRNQSATYDGTFTMYTGEDDFDTLGILDLWNGVRNTQDYEGFCGDVNGTSGELWPPVKSSKRLALFSSDVCSTLAIDYEDDQSILGIDGMKFAVTNFTFDNGTGYPEQACFKGERIVPSGIRDVSRCKYDAPAFVSLPHFYLADPIFGKAITGMNPNKTKHEMFITLEPETGIVIQAKGQLQLSLFIEPIESMSLFSNVTPIYMPMLWFSQHATLTAQYSKKLKLLVILRNLGITCGWAVLGIGLLIGLGWVGYLIFTQHKHRESDSDLLIPKEDDDIVTT